MKKFLIAGTSLIALTTASMAADLPADAAVPSVAVANAWDAFVAVGAGYTFFDEDFFGGELDDVAAEIRGTASYQFSGGFGVQGDVVFNHQAFNEDEDTSVSNTDIAGHVFYRNETFLLGAFGQYGITSAEDIVDDDTERTYIGGEGQAYFGNFTLYAQGGWQDHDLGPDADLEIDGFFFNAEARYFVTDNLKLAVNGGFETLEIEDTDFAVDTFKVGGSVEYRFDENPLSLFASVDYANHEIDVADFEFSDTRVMAGLKLNLGTKTLLERDRAGAGLDPVKPLAVPTLLLIR